MSLYSVALAITSFVSCNRWLEHFLKAAAKTLVQAFITLSARLLQRAALRYHGQLVPASAVDSERGGATSDGHQAMRPHLTSSVTFALAASETTGCLQTGYCGLQVAAWDPYVSRGRLVYCELIADSGRRRCLRSADANAVTVQARRQEFFGGGTESIEQSSRHTEKT